MTFFIADGINSTLVGVTRWRSNSALKKRQHTLCVLPLVTILFIFDYQ
jgi:hypothetical protein